MKGQRVSCFCGRMLWLQLGGGKNGTRPDKKLNLVFQSVGIVNRGCFSLIPYVPGGVDVIGQHIQI